MHAPIRNTLAAAFLALTVAAPAHAGGQVSINLAPANAEQERAMRLSEKAVEISQDSNRVLKEILEAVRETKRP